MYSRAGTSVVDANTCVDPACPREVFSSSGSHRRGKKVAVGLFDKSGTLPTITGSGELEIHDLSKPIIAFDFEEVHNLGDREIVGHRGSNS